jgi:hypothetical protein
MLQFNPITNIPAMGAGITYRSSTASFDDVLHMVGLTTEDIQVLASLKDCAADLAPFFGAILMNKTDRYRDMDRTPEFDEQSFKTWLVQLFDSEHLVSDDMRPVKRQHKLIVLPPSFLLSMLSMLLKYGRAVCAYSKDPEKAESSFEKSLALHMAIGQFSLEQSASALSELILLD